MSFVDIDGSGEIEYSEWLTATTDRKKLLSRDRLSNAFKYFDKDNSGSISVEEVKQILGVRKNVVNEGVWSDIVK